MGSESAASCEQFSSEVVKYLTLVTRFQISDFGVAQQLIESFYKVAKSQSAKLLASSKPPTMSKRSTDTQDHLSVSSDKKSEIVSNYGNFSTFLPGLTFIRNQVIKPLLFATERVFESYIKPSTNSLPERDEAENMSIQQKLQELTLGEDDQSNKSKRRRYKELDSCWSISEASDSLVATLLSDDDSTKSKSRREVKLQKKLINKLCCETEGRDLPQSSAYR